MVSLSFTTIRYCNSLSLPFFVLILHLIHLLLFFFSPRCSSPSRSSHSSAPSTPLPRCHPHNHSSHVLLILFFSLLLLLSPSSSPPSCPSSSFSFSSQRLISFSHSHHYHILLLIPSFFLSFLFPAAVLSFQSCAFSFHALIFPHSLDNQSSHLNCDLPHLFDLLVRLSKPASAILLQSLHMPWDVDYSRPIIIGDPSSTHVIIHAFVEQDIEICLLIDI